MKNIIISIALLVSINAYSQDSAYNANIKFNMTDSIDSDIIFQRKAFFETLIYNQRVASISLQFRVEYFNTNGSKKSNIARAYSKEVNITNTNYVVTSTGVLIGDINKVLTLYGKPSGDSSQPYLKFSDGRYNLTIGVMGEYDYLAKGFDTNQKLHNTIKAIGQREAAAGKLQ